MLEIKENNKVEEAKFSSIGWCHGFEIITKEQLEEVMQGKAIAIFDGEYTTWIALKEPEKVLIEPIIKESE